MDGEYSQKVLEINKTLSFVGEGSEVIVRGIGNRVFSCTENGNNLEFINNRQISPQADKTPEIPAAY